MIWVLQSFLLVISAIFLYLFYLVSIRINLLFNEELLFFYESTFSTIIMFSSVTLDIITDDLETVEEAIQRKKKEKEIEMNEKRQ